MSSLILEARSPKSECEYSHVSVTAFGRNPLPLPRFWWLQDILGVFGLATYYSSLCLGHCIGLSCVSIFLFFVSSQVVLSVSVLKIFSFLRIPVRYQKDFLHVPFCTLCMFLLGAIFLLYLWACDTSKTIYLLLKFRSGSSGR